MSKEVFLSYTWSKDTFDDIKKFHDRLEMKLRDILNDDTISIFYDKDNITADAKEKDFLPILKAHLGNSQVLIILLSRNWLESKWCNWEFDVFSKNSGRHILPVLWESIDLDEVVAFSEENKEKVRDLKSVDFIDKNTMDDVVISLAERIVIHLNH